jgi:3-oxoacyl-[acyl-carrier protein] reductase
MKRVVIVTGGAQGIGRAFALRFAADGYRVVIADTNDDRASGVRAEIIATGSEATTVSADVSMEAGCERIAGVAMSTYQRVDVLINNAAMLSTLARKPFWEIPVDEWDRVQGVNLRGTWLMMKALVPAMRENGGSIINMSSNTFQSGRTGFAHYVASKGGIVGLTRTAARELGDFNIRVNCILPGSVNTEVRRASDDPVRVAELAKQRAIKREQTPADLVGTAAFLASDDAQYITGQSFTVDGGTMLQ